MSTTEVSGVSLPLGYYGTSLERKAQALEWRTKKAERYKRDERMVGIIKKLVANEFGTTEDVLCSQDKRFPLSLWRQIAMFLCMELTELSTPQLAKEFRRVCHTTILYAHTQIELRLEHNHELENWIAKLTRDALRQANPKKIKLPS